MKRTLVLVDGLNLFHALRDQDSQNQNLNIFSICRTIIGLNYPEELDISYFTSITKHMGSKVRDAQAKYLEQLETQGAEIIFGEFRSVSTTCQVCGEKYWVHNEKKTDVALAAHLISKVFDNKYEQVLVFSADSDFLPALEMVKSSRPQIGLKVVSTPGYLRPVHGALRKVGIGTIRLSAELVAKHQFETQDTSG